MKNHERSDLLKFLNERIDRPEATLKNALDHYKVGFRFDARSIKTTNGIRSLTVHSNLYYWVLKNYGPNSEITQQCFDDIVESRIWIDLKLQETPERDVPKNLTTCAFNSICSIYLEFCNEKVPFKSKYFQYLQLVNNDEIIKPFFGVSLPIVFGLQLKESFPLEIPYRFSRPEVNNERESNEANNDQHETKTWFNLLKKMNDEQILASNLEITENFKNNFKDFWERIESFES